MLNKLEKPKTLKESALEQLRTAIMLGQIVPGERLIERTIGEQLGVSRTVVRECIRHLESEHLVEVSTSGPAVAVLASDEIRQIYQLRAMLESEAVSCCAEQAKHNDNEIVYTLQTYLSQIRSELLDNDVVTALEHTRLFYQCLFETAGMSVAWELVDRLNGRIGRLRFMTLSTPGRAVLGPDNLQKIIDGIADNNAKAAVKACQKHIDEACKIGLKLNN